MKPRAIALFLVLSLTAFAAPRAVLLDGDDSWRDANWKLCAHEFGRLLADAGYAVSVVSPAKLSLDSAKDTLVAAPSLESLPLGAFQQIRRFVADGGDLLASGGEPFKEALFETNGRWVPESEFLAGVTARVVIEPASLHLQRSSNRKSVQISQQRVPGPDGKPGALEVKIPDLNGWDTLSTGPLAANPFSKGETLTVVWVRGTPGQSLSVEWREADSSRWIARVPLTAEWRRHVLKPAEFHFWPDHGDRRREKTPFQPAQARQFVFGPAENFGALPGALEYAIGPVGVAAAPGTLGNFEPPILETISPWYKQYDAVRDGHAVRIPIARARGLSAAPEPEGRYRVAGPLLNPAATRYFPLKGGALLWIPWPELSGPERVDAVRLLRDTAARIALLDGGAREFVLLPGEPAGFGARIVNASRQPAAIDISWTVRDQKGNAACQVHQPELTVSPGENRDVQSKDLPPLPAGEYRVETVLNAAGVEIDRINGFLRVFDPQATRSPSQRIRVSDGHFTVGGRRIFLNGVNFSPRYVTALEPERYLSYWLDAYNYDPEIIEADLDLLSDLGMNVVSVRGGKPNSARPLMDFLERCRRHGIWANIFTGSASGLKPDPARDAQLLTSAHLPGNDRVFAYDLNWEPKLGDHQARRHWDAAWREWIADQYGSIAAAERIWGISAPKENGRVTNPLDEQIASDGPHRVMVAAYRRFADDLIGRVYGRVVRDLRALDPDALMGVRTGYGGTGQPSNNRVMGYDLAAGAAHLDFISPEGYGMKPEFDAARSTGFVTAYGRYAGNGKPVFWAEFGYNIGPQGGTGKTRAVQAQICESTLRMAGDSDAAGAAVWWWPGWWRVNERSDFGIVNPDGTPRESAKLLRDWGRKLNTPAGQAMWQSSRPAVVIHIDRDADARGLLGMWEKLGPEYVKARAAGRPVKLVTAGSGTDIANMPLVQVGDVPYNGTGPLKYANSEIATLRVTCPGVDKTVENGGEVAVPRDSSCQLAASVVNTGDAAWVSGACLLHTSAGDAQIRERVEKFQTASAAPLRVAVGRVPIEVTGRLAAASHRFGEVLRLRLRPE